MSRYMQTNMMVKENCPRGLSLASRQRIGSTITNSKELLSSSREKWRGHRTITLKGRGDFLKIACSHIGDRPTAETIKNDLDFR
jgi:hypothetical protein